MQGGAKDLARSQTYTYAALGMKSGGAAAGISAPPEDRAAAVEAFLTEAEPLLADGTYLPDAAKGIGLDELAPLHAADRATPPAWVTSLIAATAYPLWSLLTMRSDSMPRPLRSRDSRTSAVDRRRGNRPWRSPHGGLHRHRNRHQRIQFIVG